MINRTQLSILTLSAVLLGTLTSCGHVARRMATPENLVKRAAFSIGVEEDALTVVDGSVRSEMDSVHFEVLDQQGTRYRCYYTTGIGFTSDTLCNAVSKTGTPTKASSQKKTGNCNALLRAAGKC